MSDRADTFVLLGRAKDSMMAGLWVSLLKAAGIPAFIPGEHLVDDVAIFQRLSRSYAEDVFVPRSMLDRARELVKIDPAN